MLVGRGDGQSSDRSSETQEPPSCRPSQNTHPTPKGNVAKRSEKQETNQGESTLIVNEWFPRWGCRKEHAEEPDPMASSFPNVPTIWGNDKFILGGSRVI